MSSAKIFKAWMGNPSEKPLSPKDVKGFSAKDAAEQFLTDKLPDEVQPECDYDVSVESDDGTVKMFRIWIEVIIECNTHEVISDGARIG